MRMSAFLAGLALGFALFLVAYSSSPAYETWRSVEACSAEDEFYNSQVGCVHVDELILGARDR